MNVWRFVKKCVILRPFSKSIKMQQQRMNISLTVLRQGTEGFGQTCYVNSASIVKRDPYTITFQRKPFGKTMVAA